MDIWEILGIEETFDKTEIKRAYARAVSPGGTSKGISETAQRIPYGSETGGRKQKSDGN